MLGTATSLRHLLRREEAMTDAAVSFRIMARGCGGRGWD